MADQIFCCSLIQPYRSRQLDHEPKFSNFMSWASASGTDLPVETSASDSSNADLENKPFVVQLIRQINFGAVEFKRYFAPKEGQGEAGGFVEVEEKDLVEANFQKLNSFKNFKCTEHNKFFEVNLYQKDPVNKHHWRSDIARPAGDIDL
ncbi:hypothetical protein P7C71_g2607, partial [Lecanoromycetidae sp. Uapishka_2]